MNRSTNSWSRRGVIRSMIGGSIMLPALLSELLAEDTRRSASTNDPLAPKAPHYPAKAKRVIFLFSTGGVSHIDTFDPKHNGLDGTGRDKLVGSHWPSRPNRHCGTEITDLFPHIRDVAHEICVIRSMQSAHFDHSEATLGFHTGSATFARPSLGSWLSYGLGTMNHDLPSFIVIAPHLPYGGTQVFANDFLPAHHQGTRVVPGDDPIPNLRPRSGTQTIREMELGLADLLNRSHLRSRPLDQALAARIEAFETAFKMQQSAPEAFDVSRETDEVLQLYGLERGQTTSFAWQCLVARRLAERGVRFIELIDTGSRPNWDSHSDMNEHAPLAKEIDRPIAGLIRDLKRRGLLEETLIVWCTEFGRTPSRESKNGRGHHGKCFSIWLAGGGIKSGIVHGETNEIGSEIVSDPVDVHDVHSTILNLMGIDHTRLTYRHAGRDFRLTDVHGRILWPILA